MKLLIPADKANHYIGGQVVFCFVVAACYLTPTGLSLLHSSLWGLVITAAVAAGKEIWDYRSKQGTPEGLDFIATMLGCVLPCTLLGIAF